MKLRTKNRQEEAAKIKTEDTVKRFSVLITPDLYRVVENYRFENRKQTRKEAIVDLLLAGLVKEGYLSEGDLVDDEEDK